MKETRRYDLVFGKMLIDLEKMDYDCIVIDCGPSQTSINDAKKNLARIHEYFKNDTHVVITEPIQRKVKITETGACGKSIFEHDRKAANQFSKIIESVAEYLKR
ncbi:hypothetical protein [Anaerosolibacter sp.]|uniref:hypothetical protein n=1 Tax=Anaerosolibacter sp. TaxID=1872527 RepID=UPI0039F0A79F